MAGSPERTWTVLERNGRFIAHGSYGEVLKVFRTRSEAEQFLAGKRARHESFRRQFFSSAPQGGPASAGDEPEDDRATTPAPVSAPAPVPPAPAAPPPPPPFVPSPGPRPVSPMAIPEGYVYVRPHIRRRHRDIPEVGEDVREHFRNSGLPAGITPDLVRQMAAALGGAWAQAAALIGSNVASAARAAPPTGGSATTPQGAPPPGPIPMTGGGSGGQAPPPPVPPGGAVSPPPPPPNHGPFPASMYQALQPGTPSPPTPPMSVPPGSGPAGAPPGAFPASMYQALNPSPPPPPKPPPTRFQRFQQTFQKYAGPSMMFGRGAGRAAMMAAGAAFPELAIPAAILGEFVGSLKRSIQGLHDFAEGMVSVNRGLVPFSPRLMGGYFQLGVHEFQRSADLARRTEETGLGLVKAVDQMRSSLQEFRVAQRNLQNFAGTAGASFLDAAAKDFAPFANAFNQLFGGKGAADTAKTLGESLYEFTDLHRYTEIAKYILEKLDIDLDAFKADPVMPLEDFARSMAEGARSLGAPIPRPRKPGDRGI